MAATGELTYCQKLCVDPPVGAEAKLPWDVIVRDGDSGGERGAEVYDMLGIGTVLGGSKPGFLAQLLFIVTEEKNVKRVKSRII